LENDKNMHTIFSSSAAKPNILLYPPPKGACQENRCGWYVSEHNPEDVVRSYSQLKVKCEFKLQAYQYEDGCGNGKGMVWAIPHDRQLEMLETIDGDLIKPEFAEDDFMVAIEGDESPLSYLQAAIVWHDLHEYGAMWHSCCWSEDRVLPFTDFFQEEVLELFDQDPEGDPVDEVSITDYLFYLHPWIELNEVPDIIHPQFFYQNNRPTVVFYTINDIGYYKLRRYTHTFEENSYVQSVEEEEIGFGDSGKVF
jgi:hypothetical protein